MQLAENLSPARTPSQCFAGCGGRHRRSPTGGAANGRPLKIRTSGYAPGVPVTRPFSVRIGSETAATADAAARRTTSVAAARVSAFIMEADDRSSPVAADFFWQNAAFPAGM